MPLIYRGLFALQHRGQEGAGIVVSDGQKVHSIRGLGLLNDVFAGTSWGALPGHLGTGHVRYSTTGAPRIQNVQPLVVECVDGLWAIAHSGNLTNAARLRRRYQENGSIFQIKPARTARFWRISLRIRSASVAPWRSLKGHSHSCS